MSLGCSLITSSKTSWPTRFIVMVWHWQTVGVWCCLAPKVSHRAFTRCRYGIPLTPHLSTSVSCLKAPVFMAKSATKSWCAASLISIASPVLLTIKACRKSSTKNWRTIPVDCLIAITGCLSLSSKTSPVVLKK